MTDLYDIEVVDIKGNQVKLSEYKNRVLLIVNTASKCGFTPQYTGLENLYQKYKDKGFAVLGFPCDQFANQEPGSNAEIEGFCSLNFGVTFPLFSKIDVNGNETHPLFVYLKNKAPGFLGSKKIKWNFTKFLVSNTGDVVKRYAPTTNPDNIANDINALLNK